jgi:hypothetical protein
VEAVGGDDRACGDGELGEVALTGGFNTFLCLVRYRTGDHGSLTFRGSQPVLRDLELRPPTVYRRADGRLLNNIDVTMALQRFGLDRFRVFQSAAGDVHLKVAGIEIDEGEIRKAMLDTFGGIRVAICWSRDCGEAVADSPRRSWVTRVDRRLGQPPTSTGSDRGARLPDGCAGRLVDREAERRQLACRDRE